MDQQSPLLAQNIREYWRSSAPPAAMLLFLTFLVAGSAFIVFAKLTFPSGYKLVVVVVPVMIMVTYALMALFVRSVRLRDDQTGDNLYYMGFIFTLTSLAVALAQFEQGTGFEEIVRDFGVAISSTITGIALRVIFNQMRQDPIEVEHSARQELAEASRSVRAQLDETVLAFNHFRIQTVQSLEEAREELLKGVLSEDGVVGRVAKPIEVSAGKISAALQGFVSAMDDTSEQLAMKTTKIASSVAEVDSAMTTLSTKLAVMQMPDQIIEAKFDPLINELAFAVQEFTSKLASSVGEIDSAMMTLSAKLAAVQMPDQVIEIKLEPLVDRLAAAVTEFSKYSQTHSGALTRAVDVLARGKVRKPRSRWRFWQRG
jgi:hypothetical protein